jgi:hypothetical protein
MSSKKNLSSISHLKSKMAEQHILFVGSEEINISNIIKLMSGTSTLKQATRNRETNQTQNSKSAKPITYAELNLDSGETVHLIEVEHLFQLNQIKRHWTSKSLGVILFVDLLAEEPLEKMQRALRDYTNYFKEISVSIGVVNNDKTTELNLKSINQLLNKLKYKIAVFDVDANNFSEVSLLVQSMIISNLYGIQCKA